MADRFAETRRHAIEAQERAQERMEAARRRRSELSDVLDGITGGPASRRAAVTEALRRREEAQERAARAYESAVRAQERSVESRTKSAEAAAAGQFGTQPARFGVVARPPPPSSWIRRTEASPESSGAPRSPAAS